MNSAWWFYLAGAGLALLFKYLRWVHTGYAAGKTLRQSSHEWFDLAVLSDQVSWIVTIGVVWLCGSLYIDKVLTATGVDWLDKVLAVPVFSSAAFLLGAVMEFAAPALAKFALKKIQAE